MEDAIETIDEVEPKGFFGKKPDDMTVGDTLVYSGVVVAICVAAPLAVIGVIEVGQRVWKKFRKPKLTLVEETIDITRNTET
jgi:hypothetical protein